MEIYMRNITVVFAAALVTLASLPLTVEMAQADSNKPVASGQKKILQIDPKKDCKKVTTTVCTNKGTGMECKKVTTEQCQMY
jgi:hypothetical protein